MALLPVGAAQRMTWTWPVPAPHVEDRWALSHSPRVPPAPASPPGPGFPGDSQAPYRESLHNRQARRPPLGDLVPISRLKWNFCTTTKVLPIPIETGRFPRQ